MRRSTPRHHPHTSEPLAHFVDEYLAHLHETWPTEAAADGVHLHDDLLEDFGRAAIDARIRDLGGWARRLDGIEPSGLTPEEALEQRMLAERIRSRLFALEQEREWQRNPLFYADTLAGSLTSQVFFPYAGVEERARRIGSKLRQTPRLLEAARQNVTEAPGLFVRVGIESFEGLLGFVERDLPRAFRDLEDMHLLGDLADASTDAIDALRSYVGHLRDTLAPRSRASFRLGPERFQEKLRLDEGLDLPAERLAQIALRELRATQEEFRRVAGERAGDPADVWRKVKARHPAAGELVPAVEGQVRDLLAFLRRKRIVSIPDHAGIVVGPTPDFYRWTFASLWTAGPFETTRMPARYCVTNVDPSWSAERQEEHLRDFSFATLWSMSMHEVYPGHFLQFEHLRGVASALRKSVLFAPTSFVEGWAHYAEQVMIEQGFQRKNTEVRLGQLAEALIRLARTIVGIRLHTEDLSVEQGMRFFRDEAYLEESSARQEAERGTFDPGYVLYSLGKQMLLKLRADCEAAEGGDFDLRRFHDRLLGQGVLPFWMHRALLVGNGTLLE